MSLIWSEKDPGSYGFYWKKLFITGNGDVITVAHITPNSAWSGGMQWAGPIPPPSWTTKRPNRDLDGIGTTHIIFKHYVESQLSNISRKTELTTGTTQILDAVTMMPYFLGHSKSQRMTNEMKLYKEL